MCPIMYIQNVFWAGYINECTMIGYFLMMNGLGLYGNNIVSHPGKQVINNAQEIIIPKVQAWWQNQNVSKQLHLREKHISLIYFRMCLR